MRAYKKETSTNVLPYLDNCYIGAKLNELDEDATSVFSLFEFFRVGQIDYIQFRNFCKQYVLPSWTTLTELEKKELVLHNIAPTEEDKLVFYDIEEQFKNYLNIVKMEIEARKDRWHLVMKTAAFEYRSNQLVQLQMYNDAKAFRDDYIEADLPNLFFWLTSSAYPGLGIDYTNTGYSSTGYYNEGIKNKAVAILLK